MLLGLTGGETVLIVVAAIFIALALLVSMVIPRSRPNFPGERTGWFLLGTLVLFAAMLTAVVISTGSEEEEHGEAAVTETQPGETTPPPTESTGTTESTETETTATETTPTTTGGEGGGDAAAGKAVFASAGCASCHTLAAANASGAVGPNLDDAKPSADKVVERVTQGKGVMPSFGDKLSATEIQDVAAFVSESTRGE
jgi:mono/diheme cytochrome c family protein